MDTRVGSGGVTAALKKSARYRRRPREEDFVADSVARLSAPTISTWPVIFPLDDCEGSVGGASMLLRTTSMWPSLIDPEAAAGRRHEASTARAEALLKF